MKKLLSLLLALAMLAGIISMFSFVSFADDPAPTAYSKGDINNSGTITTKDALLLKKYLADKVDFDLDEWTAADVDGDGCVSAKDARAIICYLVCMINNFDGTELSKIGYTDSRQDVKIGGVALNATNYCIVMPNEFKTEGLQLNCDYNTPNGFHFAVRRLKGYLGTITGKSLNIVAANDTATLANYPHKIYCQAAPIGTYADEAFNITTSNSDVYLTCSADSSKLWTQRGMFYAVFTFIEDYLDVKFYEDYEPYIPIRSGGITIPNGINRTETPVFKYRVSAGHSFGTNNGWEQSKWYLITRKINGFDGNYSMNDKQVGYAIGSLQYHAHSLGQYLGTPNVNPCLSSASTESSIKTAIGNLIAQRRSWVDNWQYITQISCSIEDVVTVCSCATCKAKYSSYGCFNGVYMEFVNKIASWLTSNYPSESFSTYSVLYDHLIPTGIAPLANEVWCYCGTGCNNHTIAGAQYSGLEGDTCTTPGYVVNALGNGGAMVTHDGTNTVCGHLNDGVNTNDKTRLRNWATFVHNSGAQLYFWYYPTNVNYFICPTPNYTNVYYDIKYLASIGVDGVYSEGDSHEYAFEGMREYLIAEMLWNPNMSFAQYERLMDKYLECHVGHRWRYIREYIKMNEAAGDAMTCWIDNFDAPWSMVSRSYYRNNYDTMRGLFDSALGCEDITNKQRNYILATRLHCDFLGISAQFGGGRTLSSANQQRYLEMFNYIKNNNANLGELSMHIPSSVNYNQDPMLWFDAWNDSANPGTHRPGNFT